MFHLLLYTLFAMKTYDYGQDFCFFFFFFSNDVLFSEWHRHNPKEEI